MHGWMDRQVDEYMDGWIDECIDGYIVGWADRWMDNCSHPISSIHKNLD